MLGFAGTDIALAYILSIASAFACVAFGIMNWNKGGEPDKIKLKKVIIPEGVRHQSEGRAAGETE